MVNRYSTLGLAALATMIRLLMSGCGGGGGGSAVATGALEGYVYVPDMSRAAPSTRADAPTGYVPLNSANVEVTAGIRTYQTATDAEGHFSISGLAVGVASVRITPPPGQPYRSLNTFANVLGGSTARIGEGGNVSLLSSAAADLAMSVEEIDLSAWPTVKLHVSVNDPSAHARVVGVRLPDFTVNLNGKPVMPQKLSIFRERYMLTLSAPDATAQQCDAQVSATFCDRDGSASYSAARDTKRFVLPVGDAPRAFRFTGAGYDSEHPGMWHMGIDYGVRPGNPVYAIANGEVVRRVLTGQVTGLVVRHWTNEDLATSADPTRMFYAVYGYINAIVPNGSMVEAGQQIGTVAQWAPGSHLHFGIRVGQDITGEWRMANCVGGLIPLADAHGWTNGWADPLDFFATHTPDNSEF